MTKFIFLAKIHLKENVKWIKLNADQNGFYRVLYDKETLNEIISQLKVDHTKFSTKDRMGLISDSFALCHSNLLDCNLTLELTSYLPLEKSYGPVVVAIKHFEKFPLLDTRFPARSFKWSCRRHHPTMPDT